MKISAFLIALGLVSPTLAGDLIPVTKIGHIYTATADEPFDLQSQLKRNAAHERRTYTQIVAEGGCNAELNTFEYASFCGAKPFGFPMGSVGD